MPTIPERLETATAEIEADKELLHSIVHGAADDPDVTTEGGDVKPIAKVIAEGEAQIAALVTSLDEAVDASEAARDASIAAKDTSVSAKDTSVAAAGTSTAQAAIATTKAGEAETARAAAVVAKDASVAAQGLSEAARDTSVTAKTASEAARDLAQGYRDTAQTHANTATTKAGEAAASQAAAATSEANALTSKNLASDWAIKATSPDGTANQSAKTYATNAGNSAAAAAASATTALNAVAQNFLGTVAGNAVPATAAAAGRYYIISSAGTSQGKTWVFGDWAIYNGVSGSWSQLSGTLVDSILLARRTNSLAPAQGLVFDGTSVSGKATLSSALGTTGSTIEYEFDVPASNPPTLFALWHLATARTEGTPGEYFSYITTTGAFRVYRRGVTVGDARIAEVNSNLVATFGGTRVKAVVTQSGNTLVISVNGVSLPFTEITSGAGAAWSDSITGTLLTIGMVGSNYSFTGFIGPIRIYNRVLSAAEILTNYFRNSPAATDYNNASNTSIVPADFASGWTSDGGFTPGVSGVLAAGGNAYKNGGLAAPHAYVMSRRFRVEVTIDAIDVGADLRYYNGSAYVSLGTTTGLKTAEFSMLANYANLTLKNFGTNTLTISAPKFYPLGLLFSPEQNAPGNGYQWKDMSGNKADILLPVSGVTWALPDRRPNSVRVTLTWAGTHEAKSFFGQRCIPSDAVFDLIATKATAGSSGSGLRIFDAPDSFTFVSVVSYTNAKKVHAIARVIPGDTTDNGNNLALDPDTANYTGSISVEVFYKLSEGTP